MRHKICTSLLLTLVFVCSTNLSTAQKKDDGGKKLPNVILKNMDGEEVKISELENDGKPIVINFWATWCSPCKRELNAIDEHFIDWTAETGVKFYAVSVDDQRTKSRVKPFVDGSGWEYNILLDPNGKLKRAMGVNNVPHTFLINGKGEVVWQHNNYNPGDEYELYDKIVALNSKAETSKKKEGKKEK